MERGLLWLPLLVLFFWLAWAGWNEYQKVEAYRIWAESFERSKYDIYAVLGQKGREITWGKPTRKAPKDLQTFSLDNVRSIRLLVNGKPVEGELPNKGKAALEFTLKDTKFPITIPFTEVSLAAEWGKFLENKIEVSA